MRTVFFKHALLAGSLAASLGTLAAPVAVAVAATPSPGTAAPNGSTPGGSTPSGSPSGGAAPTPAAPGKALATWFGPGFYGHSTACGQTMSPTLVGVASRTLPCGTLVQVGFRGRLLTVPVLDRGPYGHNGAVWDLTTGAARALAIKDTVHVTAQVVGHVPNTPTLGEPPPGAPSGPLTAPPSAAATTGGATAG
jgi:Lytic transglycolase